MEKDFFSVLKLYLNVWGHDIVVLGLDANDLNIL